MAEVVMIPLRLLILCPVERSRDLLNNSNSYPNPNYLFDMVFRKVFNSVRVSFVWRMEYLEGAQVKHL